MKFTFDGNIYENNNSSQDFKSDQKIILSGLIFESNVRLASPLEAEVNAYMAMNDRQKADFFATTLSKRSQPEIERFINLWESKLKSDSSRSSGIGSTSSNPLDQMLNFIKGVASQDSIVPDLAKKLECRYYVIQRLKSQIDVQKIAYYFTKLQSVYNLTDNKTCAILNRGADVANKTGARVENVLDFVVEAYGKVRSIALLDQFLSRAEQVTQENRSVPVFQILLGAVSGKKTNSSAYMMTIKDPQQMIMFNELVTMVQAGPVEDMEQLRRSWQGSLDKLDRETEKYYRKIQVYNMFKEEVRNQGLSEVIKGLGSLFNYFQRTGLLDIITNTYLDFKAGMFANQLMRTPFTREPKVEVPNDPSSQYLDTGRAPIVGSSKKFIKVAQLAPPGQQSSNQGEISSVTQLLSLIITSLTAGIALFSAFPAIQSLLKQIVEGLKNFNDNSSLDDIIKFLNGFVESTTDISEQSREVGSYSLNSNIRIARLPAAFAGIASFFTRSFTSYLNMLVTDPAQTIKVTQAIVYLIINAVRTFGSAFWGKKLQRDPMFYDSQGNFNPNSPERIAYVQQMTEAGVTKDRIDAMLTFRQTREIVKDKILNYEKKLNSVLEITVQTSNVNSITQAPLKSPQSAKIIYDGFMTELRGAVVQFNKEIDFLKSMASEGVLQLQNQVSLNLVTQHLREAEADLQTMKNLIGKYYSFDMIIENVIKKMRLMKLIKPLMAKISKFQVAGISTAAAISDPHGIMPILNKVREAELENITKLKAELSRLTSSLPDNIYM